MITYIHVKDELAAYLTVHIEISSHPWSQILVPPEKTK